MPAPRSKTTCNQCRARKVRCGGGPSPCANCSRLHFECSFDDTTTPATTIATLGKRRGARACLECRSSKTKCSGELPTCAGCLSCGKTCSYAELKRSARRPEVNRYAQPDAQSAVTPGLESPLRITSDPPTILSAFASPESGRQGTSASGISTNAASGGLASESHPLPPLRDRLHLVIDFFRHIHPIPFYAFLYEEATVQRCLEETIDTALIHSICAITALLLGYSKYHPFSTDAWVTRVENIIWTTIEQPTIFKLQALILAIEYRIITGSFQRSFMLFPLATRSATALRLAHERSTLSAPAQEIRRRLMWSLVLMDGHFAIGLPECESCPYETIHLKLPGPEESFNADLPSASDELAPLGLDGVAEGGLLSIYVQEYKIRRDLLRLKRELDIATQPFPQVDVIVEDFVKALRQILPEMYSTEQLQHYSRSRWKSRYLAVHLSWHQCHCDAYRLFLRGYKESAPPQVLSVISEPYIVDAVAQCVHHAQEIIRILHDADTLNPRLEVSCIDMAICGYHACRLLLFISQSTLNPPESGITVESALESAASALDTLRRLHSVSAVARLLIKELERLIQGNIVGKDQNGPEVSDPDEDDSIRPQGASTPKRPRGLGIHSILRQARFPDDSALAAQRSSLNISGRFNLTTGPSSSQEVPNHELHSSGFHWQQAPRESMESGADHVVNGRLNAHPSGALSTLSQLPQAIFETATLDTDQWATWQNTLSMNDWFVQPDSDFF